MVQVTIIIIINIIMAIPQTHKIKKFFKKYKCNKLFLVTGKKSFSLSGCKEIIDKLDGNIDIIQFDDFPENPEISYLKKGIVLFKKEKCDSILSVGGGSVMDMGKLISLLHNCDLNDIDSIQSYSKTNKRHTPIMCIPTTAGSGSETTHFCVLYSNGIKYSIANRTLIPDSVLLNPEFSYSMSQFQKAVSGLDALSQGIESFWAKNSTPESRKFSKEAIILIWNNLYDSVISNDFCSHEKIVKGSHLAGKAINISKTTAPHALSYYFTEKHNIKHGHAVMLTLPKIYHLNRLKALKSNTIFKDIFFILDEILEINNNPISTIENFIKKLNIDIDFKNLGINIKKELNDIKLAVNSERFNNNPFDITTDEIFN